MPLFYALPYDISASGFYFRSREEYDALRLACRGDSGLPVEEFEIQFIDGETLDAYFADAFGLNQTSVFRIIDLIEEWDDDAKRRFIIAVGECGYMPRLVSGNTNAPTMMIAERRARFITGKETLNA